MSNIPHELIEKEEQTGVMLVCPQCHQVDGKVQVAGSSYSICLKHNNKWVSELGNYVEEDKDTLERKMDFLETLHSVRPATVRQEVTFG